jgi:hypothetical protein
VAGKRASVDWEKIEAEFRAGQLSIKEIARANGITDTAIRKRARLDGWSRALAEKVRETVKEKLVRADGSREGSRPQRASDKEIIEAAALRGLDVIASHRADLQQLHGLKRIILTRLSAHLKGEPVEGPFMGDKESPGDLVEKLSRVTARLIPLERQAHNLDEGVDTGGIHINLTRDESAL